MFKNITKAKITSVVGLIVGVLAVYGYINPEQATGLTALAATFASTLLLFTQDPK